MRGRTVLKRSILSGVGLHSGKKTIIELNPAVPSITSCDQLHKRNPTISSKNIFWDISSRTTYSHDHIYVTPDSVCDTSLSTSISAPKSNGELFTVSTIEHLMAALWAFKITDINMSITGDEVPIFDGSSKMWCDELRKSEVEYFDTEIHPIIIDDTIRIEDGDSFLEVSPSDTFSVDITIDFPYKSIGRQRYNSVVNSTIFNDELSFCRTFVHMDDVLHLKMMGKALGGSLDNAIVVDDNTILNTDGLRVKDEFVKHKVLDLIGDLWTLGRPIMGKVTGYKPGHRINNLMARKLYDIYHMNV